MRTPRSRRRLFLFMATNYCGTNFVEAFQSILVRTHTHRPAPLYGSVLADGSANSDSLIASESDIGETITSSQISLPNQNLTPLHYNQDQDAYPDPVPRLPTAAEGVLILPQNATTSGPAASETSSLELSRRKWFQIGAMLLVGATTISLTPPENHHQMQKSLTTRTTALKSRFQKAPSSTTVQKKIQKIKVADIARETNINLTMECTTTCVSLDRYTFEKKATLKLPSWVPSYLVPPPRTIRKLSDTEILVAAIVAGSTVEMARTSLLYPILTLKSRIQGDIKKRVRTRLRRGNTRRLHSRRRAKILRLNIVRHFREGNLYAGLLPSLLVSVPATGVYYGVRDVVRRFLYSLPGVGDVAIAVFAALVADVVSLIIRTPADTLAVRLQVATGKQQHNQNRAETTTEGMSGNWFVESLERLPAVILTDLPYLLSRTALNRFLIHGNVDLGHYELTVISTALVCGFLTTPFDVARTRILLDSDDDPTNGIDGGSGAGLITTMRTVTKEGEGGLANLFAGWLERTMYLGIGRAWLEPLQILGYMAIRDAILLEWFD